MKKIYNDQSPKFSDWTTKKLKDEASAYYQSIYVHECYGMSDLRHYDGICSELSDRGIEPKTKLYF